jgi:hypothetical protein
MLIPQIQVGSAFDYSPEEIREQLDLLVRDEVFRSSKRSVQFLRYVVEQTLKGAADQIKERTVGIEVFGRDPSYDTNGDHIVRTAAIEIRKRLAIYYGQEKHRSELRMNLVPGSYIPIFTRPIAELESAKAATPASPIIPLVVEAPVLVPPLVEPVVEAPSPDFRRRLWKLVPPAFATVLVVAVAAAAYFSTRRVNAQDLFWKPVLDTPGAVLIAVGDVPKGPPTSSAQTEDPAAAIPIVHKTSSPTVPFADAVTIARVTGELRTHGKAVNIRREEATSFSDLREGAVVLVGAFNNEWSLRLTRQMRYTLALDPVKHLIYIRDAKQPDVRKWNWATDQPIDNQGTVGGPPLEDYALISRIWNSETGHVMVFIGGLYTYGTEAAGEFLADPQTLQKIASPELLKDTHRNLQIVLGTKVTDGTAGPPRVLAVSFE